MSDYGILFSGLMVTALWNGRKTQTRRLRAPRWKVGDELWVRENYRLLVAYDHLPPIEVPTTSKVFYEADSRGPIPGAGKLRSSIHLPRCLSRLSLIVEEIRQEPLRSITWDEAIAEGLTYMRPQYGVPEITTSWNKDPRLAYYGLWDHINPGAPVALNPVVWVTVFHVKQ